MTTVIRVDVVLQEAVDTPYRDLVTRPTGVAVRDRVLRVLRDRAATDAELDFSAVGVLDFSCADEVVAKLAVVLHAAASPRLRLSGLRPDHIDAIEGALERHEGVVLVAFSSDAEPQLLGAAHDDWRTVIRALGQLGRTPAAPIADQLAWSVGRADRALRALADHQCVVAHPDATYELGAVA